MKVEADYVCEHGMPQPWATCNECMFLPLDQQPVPPKPEPAPPKPAKKRANKSRAGSGSAKKKSSSGSKASRPSTALPRSDTAPVPDLIGDMDLAYEIPSTHLQYHVQGPGSDWLPISSMPVELRPGGWFYLKSDQWLVARVRVKKIGFREKRWTHESSESTSDVGPGATLELDGDNWELIRIDLGPEGDAEVLGYRYLVTAPDDRVSLPASE